MSSKTSRKSKYSHLIEKIKKELGPVFRPSELKKIIAEVVREESIEKGDAVRNEVLYRNLANLINTRKHGFKLKVHNLRASEDLYSFKEVFDPLLAARAFVKGKGHYLGNLSAMYLLGLTDQRPKSYYICHESLSASSTPFEYSPDQVKLLFMKSHRISDRYFEYGDNRYYMLEKQIMNACGLIDYILKDEEFGEIKICISNLERTFLDSIISPQYSGGISQVIESFKDQEMDLNKLKQYYDSLSPKYPYWQKIGFILSLNENINIASEWKNFFKNIEMKDFFLDKEYRSSWTYSEEWKIFYPKGIYE